MSASDFEIGAQHRIGEPVGEHPLAFRDPADRSHQFVRPASLVM